MVVGIELARAMEPLTFFQMKFFNAQLAIRHKSATQLNTQTYCEKTLVGGLSTSPSIKLIIFNCFNLRGAPLAL